MANKNYGKKSYHRNYRLRKVRIQSEFAIGALAADDVIAAAITANVADKLRLISINLAWTIADIAAVADDTFQFGVAHGDYTAAEIEECLEAQAALDLGDKVAQEQSDRLVRTIGVISSAGGTNVGGSVQFNEGRPMKTRLNWLMSEADNLSGWVRNGSANVYSSGSLLTCIGELWVKD